MNKNNLRPIIVIALITVVYLLARAFGPHDLHREAAENYVAEDRIIQKDALAADDKKEEPLAADDKEEELLAVGDDEEELLAVADKEDVTTDYSFRNAELLLSHYEKHGIDMGFASESDYEKAASAVINNKDALHKIEAEDGDDIFYLESTNEFVVLSKDGYIRTYFNPDSGIKYYNKQ